MKKFRPFIAGVLTTVLAGSLTISTLAITNRMTITVDPINIQVNGETFQPKDVNGKDVPVFVYDGSTYAPLRALAEAYGLEVEYDSEKNMATVVDPDVHQSIKQDSDYSGWSSDEEEAYQKYKSGWTVDESFDTTILPQNIQSKGKLLVLVGEFDVELGIFASQDNYLDGLSNNRKFAKRLLDEINVSSDTLSVFCCINEYTDEIITFGVLNSDGIQV